jgi:hypothetical protein
MIEDMGCASNSIRIHISSPNRDLDNRVKSYVVEPENTIFELKSLITEDTSSISRHVLIFHGQILKDDKTLHQVVGDRPEVTFHLVIKPNPQSDSDTASRPFYDQNISTSSSAVPNISIVSTTVSNTSTDRGAVSTSSSYRGAVLTNNSSAHTSAVSSGDITSAVDNNDLRTSVVMDSSSISNNDVHPGLRLLCSEILPVNSMIRINVPTGNSSVNVDIPCYDQMFINCQDNNLAFCISPPGLLKLESVGVSLNLQQLYVEESSSSSSSSSSFSSSSQRHIEGQEAGVRRIVIRINLSRLVNIFRRYYDVIILALKLILFMELFVGESTSVGQFWTITLTVLGVLVWHSRVLDRYLQPIRQLMPALHVHLPHALPAAPRDYECDEDFLADLENNRGLLQSIKNTFIMFVGSFLPTIYDNWVEEDRHRRRLHAEHLVRLRLRAEEMAAKENNERSTMEESSSIEKNISISEDRMENEHEEHEDDERHEYGLE